MYLSAPISVSYTKKCAKLLSQKLWEEDWKTQLNSLTPNTKWVQKLFPDLNSFTDIWKYGKLSHTLTSIYTGHCSLAYFQHKIGRSESATCECGQDIETPEHYMFHCELWDYERKEFGYFGGDQANYKWLTKKPEQAKKFISRTKRLSRTRYY